MVVIGNLARGVDLASDGRVWHSMSFLHASLCVALWYLARWNKSEILEGIIAQVI